MTRTGEGRKLKKVWRVMMLAALLLVLSGCVFRTPDELYQLPQKSPGYEMLTKEISEVQRNLEIEFGKVESAIVYAGDHTSNIQLQDLNSDGTPETVVTFLRVPGAELPLRIYFFTKQPDNSYEVSCVVEGPGVAIYAVDYEDLSGDGWKELVVSWQTSANIYQLGVYSLSGSDAEGVAQADQMPEATELMRTTYSGYSLLDIDQDSRTELIVARVDPAGTNSQTELYGWSDGTFASLGSTRLSNGIAALTKVRANFVTDLMRAVYITSTLTDGGQATDIVAWRKGELVNLTLNPETGISNETIRGYTISPQDVNSDMILEMPRPHLMPSTIDGVSRWFIDWSQYDLDGDANRVFTTYHDQSYNWYFEIPDHWVNEVTVTLDTSVSGERAVIFQHWNGPDEEPTPFLAIYLLTGINRNIRAEQGDRFILSEDTSTIYAASFVPCKWNHGLDEMEVLNRFHRTVTSWANE